MRNEILSQSDHILLLLSLSLLESIVPEEMQRIDLAILPIPSRSLGMKYDDDDPDGTSFQWECLKAIFSSQKSNQEVIGLKLRSQFSPK